MSRFLPASPARRKLFLRLPLTLLLLLLLWWSLGCPALTLQGALRRMGRENFVSPGALVASGSISLDHPGWRTGNNTNAWAVTYGEGAYRVAKLNRVLGFLWKPSDDGWSFYVHDEDHRPGLPYWGWGLQMAGGGTEYESVGLFFLDGAARVETSVYRVPAALRGNGDVDWDACELVETYPAARQADGIWLMQYTLPYHDEATGEGGDGYFVRFLAYRADGSILYSS